MASDITYPSNITSNFKWGDGKYYVPKFMVDMFGAKRGSDWNKTGKAAKAANLLWQTLKWAAIAGGGTLAARTLAHWMDVDNIENASPNLTAGGKLDSINERSVDPALTGTVAGKKKKKKLGVTKQASFGYDIALGTIPVGAGLLAMLAAMSVSDKYYDKKLGRKLDKMIAKEQQIGNSLAKQRIMATRVPQTQLIKQESLNKQAWDSLKQKVIGSAALLATIIAGLGVAGGYNWQRSNSKPTAKYKAYKKGLQEYNRNLIASQAVQSRPLDPKLMALFNSGLDKNKKQDTITNDPMKEILI